MNTLIKVTMIQVILGLGVMWAQVASANDLDEQRCADATTIAIEQGIIQGTDLDIQEYMEQCLYDSDRLNEDSKDYAFETKGK